MNSTETQFLSIRDAVAHTGKSTSTIRRLIREITKNNAHRDRHHIHPEPAEVEKLKARGEQFVWTLSQEILEKELMGNAEHREGASGPMTTRTRISFQEIIQEELRAKERNLEAVMDQLKVKDQQIARQSDIIEALNERLREGNLLMGSLQRQLQLKEGSDEKKETVIDAEPVTAKNKAKEKSKKAEQGSATPKKKVRWWERKIW
jgi:hypothetical protein